MSSQNRITNVAVVGAGGNVGRYMTDALLKTGKHNVTAITRHDSKTELPKGVSAKKVDYTKYEELLEALKGQDALVITMGGFAPKEHEKALLKAAGEAGISWILPNEWGPDTTNEGLNKDIMIFQPKEVTRKYIRDLGKSNYICVSTGFWYEWSLAIPPAYGFDLQNHKVTFFDEGESKISTSTWPQVGRAVATILSMPIQPEGSNKENCLEHLKNKVIYFDSFTVSQKDMFESVKRVTGTSDSDWTITKQPAEERYTKGLEKMKGGDRNGFAEMLYTRVFYPDGSGDVSHKTINNLLQLPKEDMDEGTKRAIERSGTDPWKA